MAQRTTSKAKLSRKLGIALTPKAARVMARRPHPPGEGMRRGRRRTSDYRRQLLEKQKLRAQYNIGERQLVNYFEKARNRARQADMTVADALIQLLEKRLDAAVLHGGLAPTIYAAQQLVAHGHVLVNGGPVNVPSYAVEAGDTVSIKPESRDLPLVTEAVEPAAPPPYLQLDKEQRSVKLLNLPRREEVPVLCDMALMLEYYSR